MSADQLLADAVLLLHFGIVLFVVGGLPLVVAGNLRGWGWVNRLWFRAAHLAAIGVVAAQAWLGQVCPLTTLESWLRVRAGGTGYRASFVEHWVQRVLFHEAPPWVFTAAYTLFALLVALAWWRFPPRRPDNPRVSIRPCSLPAPAVLAAYRARGAYVDCYTAHTPRRVSHAEFVAAFYTTWVFRIERWLLARLAGRLSTDADAARLARGEADRFAAWSVEARGDGQLLLADFTGRTRSWLMTQALDEGGTRLYFGSAVVPVMARRTGEPTLGPVFHLLLGFHRLYARVLLHAACRRLARR